MMGENNRTERRLSRRSFIKGAAAAGVLAASGALFLGTGCGRTVVETAERKLFAELRVNYLRQIVTQDTGRARVLMWEMPAPAADQVVELRTAGQTETRSFDVRDAGFTDDGVTVYQYAAAIDELTPGTSYEYRVRAGDAATAWMPLAAPAEDAPYKMIIFPDSQSSDYTDWQNVARGAWERNRDAAVYCNMGDLVDNGEDRSQWAAWFEGFDADMLHALPFVPVMGNHETYNRDWKVRLPEAYLHYFDVPANGSAQFERYYYSFDFGSVHYIVLNTMQQELDEFIPGLVEEQQAWIRRDMAAHRKKWNIVMMHKDVLQYRINGRPERTEGFSEDGNLWMPLFDELGIDIVYTAHLHTYRNRGHIYGFAKQPDKRGPLYILTGVAGNVRYPNLWVDHAMDDVTLPQPETDNYLTMEVGATGIEIACFLPDGTEMDRVRVEK